MFCSTARADGELPSLNIDGSQTTVSGISSGAFMAVQFGVAHSASVSGVAATAGGPYFCAGKDSWAGAGVSKAIARCMQGDPSYSTIPITEADLAQMQNAARVWSKRGNIDPVENLSRQRVWLFHGYNDGIVKKPVNDALYRWYRPFVPATQLFYKDHLPAAHAQISAMCGTSKVCKPCAVTGGDFINSCRDGDTSASLYDGAGAALQFFYGPLVAPSTALSSKPQRFNQRPYIRRGGEPVMPSRVSMANEGYLYVPSACAAGEPCRLHVAFHGCMQQAERIGSDFVDKAGFNEWADANHIVVLYPQTVAAVSPPVTPLNPMGCWDWWGYNDFSFDPPGHYATRDGVQIAAVWNMVQRLASGHGTNGNAANATAGAPALRVLDLSPKQVALQWKPVSGAASYRVYRNQQALGATGFNTLVDDGVTPAASFTYTVRPVDGTGKEGPASQTVTAKTPALPPASDPYFSLAKNKPVTRDNVPTTRTCP
jgi:poly(3-hydroxybutyrate) depolymerase